MAGSREAIDKMENKVEPKYTVIIIDVEAAYEIVRASNHVFMSFKVKYLNSRIFITWCWGSDLPCLYSGFDTKFKVNPMLRHQCDLKLI